MGNEISVSSVSVGKERKGKVAQYLRKKTEKRVKGVISVYASGGLVINALVSHLNGQGIESWQAMMRTFNACCISLHN